MPFVVNLFAFLLAFCPKLGYNTPYIASMANDIPPGGGSKNRLSHL